MSPPAAPRPAPKKRLSRRRVQLVAAAAGFASFAMPWIAFKLAPGSLTASAKQQVVVVPAGSRVTVIKPVGSATNVTVITAKGSSAPAPISTSASAPPPKI
jgi:ferric-dicitrate binding protein FerR (iron transport regulator)